MNLIACMHTHTFEKVSHVIIKFNKNKGLYGQNYVWVSLKVVC